MSLTLSEPRQEWKRLGKNKSQIVGCVVSGQLNKHPNRGGYITLKTTATRDMFVYIPSLIFRELIDYEIRPQLRRFTTPYTEAEAKELIKFLRGKMIVIQCETWVCGDMTEYRCHTRGLMKGEGK